MSNKEFYKRFEEILNEIFNEKHKSNTPMDAFFKGLKTDDFSNEFKKFRNSVRKTNDGLFTTVSFIFRPDFNESDDKELKYLKMKLEQSVKNEDFEESAKLRDKIKELKNNTSKIDNLKKELDIVIKEQNFERAIEIRDELKKIN
jgi:excinuclease UvrABC helicase subunit UvrB